MSDGSDKGAVLKGARLKSLDMAMTDIRISAGITHACEIALSKDVPLDNKALSNALAYVFEALVRAEKELRTLSAG